MHAISLIKRNIYLFFSDKTAVFFSMMAIFVVLFLYVAFLGEYMIQPLKIQFPNYAREISDTWIMAGTLGIISLTTSLSVLGITIDDRNKGIINDFKVSPLTDIQITLAYIFSTFLITVCISCITLGIAQGYIWIYGGRIISLVTLLKIGSIMCVSTFSCTAMLYVILSFFKSTSAFSNVTTIIGTLSGFLMGIYVPIGSLPEGLQHIIRFFPPSHCATLFREAMMEAVLQDAFKPLTNTSLVSFKEQFGIQFVYGNYICTPLLSYIILIILGILFFIIAFKKTKTKG
jgi:multidrug/hemolysin transport system permease protein